jgi:hypothetical protein
VTPALSAAPSKACPPNRDDGHDEIVDVGTYAELVARPGLYQNMYNEEFESTQEEPAPSLHG